MTENIPVDVVRAAIKEALSEWLDKTFAAVGKWTVKGLAAALFAAAVGGILHVAIR